MRSLGDIEALEQGSYPIWSRKAESPMNRRRLVIVVDRFPSMSETFIFEEISALQEYGYSIYVVSLRPPDECNTDFVQQNCDSIIHVPRMTNRGCFFDLAVCGVVDLPSTCKQLGIAARCSRPGLHGWWRAVRAFVVARRLKRTLGHLGKVHVHAHFLHRTALVGKLLAYTLNCPYSISAHGRDIFAPDFLLNALGDQAKFIAVCSRHAEIELARHFDEQNRDKIVRCYHGLNLERFSNEKSPDVRLHDPPSLVSVCRLVKKKGIDIVIRALSILEARGISLNYRIIGTGREEKGLRDLSLRLGLSRVDFLGGLSPNQVRQAYCEADLFALGCRMTEDGDRDGIPNAILEAMAMGLPVVATDVGGVSEIIADRHTGCLVPAEDPVSMANALETLIKDDGLRARIAEGARAFVVARFDARSNIRCLISHLESSAVAETDA